jgi:hypothetical protein
MILWLQYQVNHRHVDTESKGYIVVQRERVESTQKRLNKGRGRDGTKVAHNNLHSMAFCRAIHRC